MTVWDVDISAKVDKHKERFWDNLNPGQSFTIEGTHCRKNGSTFPVEVQVACVSMHEQLLLLGLARDISKRKQLESQLRQSHKMEAIGTLAGGIAHDFNNMLSIIIGNTELAMDDIPEWNLTRYNLEEIKTASLRAKDIV